MFPEQQHPRQPGRRGLGGAPRDSSGLSAQAGCDREGKQVDV